MSTKQSLPRWLRKFDVSYTKSIIFSPGVIIGRALRYLWKKKNNNSSKYRAAGIVLSFFQI